MLKVWIKFFHCLNKISLVLTATRHMPLLKVENKLCNNIFLFSFILVIPQVNPQKLLCLSSSALSFFSSVSEGDPGTSSW